MVLQLKYGKIYTNSPYILHLIRFPYHTKDYLFVGGKPAAKKAAEKLRKQLKHPYSAKIKELIG